MNSIYNCLACAVSAISNSGKQHLLLTQAINELQTSADLALSYHQTLNSIWWNKAKSSTKRCIRFRLHELVYMSYTHFLDGCNYLNEYAAMHEKEAPCAWWYSTIVSLNLVYDTFSKYYNHRIYSLQLSFL